jgi:DNA polymerase III epsilon subunit-like protein|uniref:Exonuclease domain-containing protein n=1 Tax=viral metagenome TaxID=1070528 RepID=A0A6C0AKK4_9ZZZZ
MSENKKALIFDTETTGLPNKKYGGSKYGYIVQISWIMIDLSTHKLLKTRDCIIRIPYNIKIPKEASDIHGITNKIMRQKGINIKPVLREIINDMRLSNVVVAHNINFDISFLKIESFRNGLGNIYNTLHIKKYDTMFKGKIIADTYRISPTSGKKVLKVPKLLELHQKLFKTTPLNLHNSLIDIYVCLRCYYKLEYDVDILTINSSFRSSFNELCNPQSNSKLSSPLL